LREIREEWRRENHILVVTDGTRARGLLRDRQAF
jgi:hypothetical protein